MSAWQAALGEKPKCVRKVGNRYDLFAVAAIRAGETVRYMYKALVLQASLARKTNPAFTLCYCETEAKYAR